MKKLDFIRRYRQLLRGYWTSGEWKKAVSLLIVVVAMNFLMVYLIYLLNVWNREFYNALQEYQIDLFLPLLGKFTGYALLYITIAVYAIYLQQLLQLHWRAWMTEQYIDAWMGDAAYYRLQVMGADMDNPEQRIQDDINQFTSLSLSLFIGSLRQITTLITFAFVLWELSGDCTFTLFGASYTIPGYMLWCSLLYSVIGTWLAHIVGRRLIRLNFDQQRYEADFRFTMTRVRENAESIAFYSGESVERLGFFEHFAFVMKNFRTLMQQTKLLNFYSNFYNQFANIAPYILAAPRYFSGEMQLGGFMQTASAFLRVQDALSYFLNVYDSVAQLIAVVHRLIGFTAHLEEASAMQPAVTVTEAKEVMCEAGQTHGTIDATNETHASGATSALILRDIKVTLPNGQVLADTFSLAMPRGKRLLITGASGTGKSTLLRALAGLWPHGTGLLTVPQDTQTLFLSQRPYLPLGTLARALCYPKTQETLGVTDDDLRQILIDVDLGALVDRLGDTDDWSRILSLGEQQRIAFARILLNRPAWVFLDEATSALDEAREKMLYTRLHEALPETGFMSVGHRSTLFAQHDKELHLENGIAVLRDISHADV